MTGKTRQKLKGYAFLSPWLIGMALFISYPFFAALYFSFCDYPPLKGPEFIGLGNYRELAVDPAFHRSLGVTLLYASVAIPLGVILALTLAIMLNSRIRGLSVYRTVFYLPQLVPTVVVAILWLWIFNPEVGLLQMITGGLAVIGDAWTGTFFHLQKLHNQVLAARPTALLLLAGPLLIVLTRGGIGRKLFGNLPRTRTALRWAAGVTTVLAVMAVLPALGYRFAPTDMEKLRSPTWLSDASPFPSGVSWAPSWALWGLIIMSLWGVGQMAVIYLAKLQDVPVELYEAADIDGASWWRKTINVTIPMVSPVILFNVVMAIITAFQVFAQPYIMTEGGPEGKTRFVALFVYEQAFQYHRLGYASAVAAVLFALIVVLTLLAFRLSNRHVHYEGR
ncbi:MAG: carbohydrate ABC transporter permease [Planctomycetota bacterium]